jgi:peptidoglycan/LPS O-acetylase OafA/YrhL
MSQDAHLLPAAVPLPQPALRLGGHLPSLDGLRGIAIALVMLHHFTIYGGMRPVAWMDRLYYKLGISAWCGVDLFFVLSGLLITGILIDAKGSSGYFRNFYARRALRIFPLYYGTLVIVFWVVPALVTGGPAFAQETGAQHWYWTYLVNVRTALYGWPAFLGLGHFWSLAVEEQFYLLWPAVVLVSNRRTLTRLCFALVAGSLLLRTGLAFGGWNAAAYVLMPARMDALAVGALIAAAVRDPLWWQAVRCWAGRVGGMAAAGLGALFLFEGQLHQSAPLVETVGFTLTALLSGGLVVAALDGDQHRLISRALSSRPLRFLGRYSYGLYVFHHLLVFPLAAALPFIAWTPRLAGSQLPGQLLFVVAATAASIAVALLSWYCWEQPFLRLKRFFPHAGGSAAGDRPAQLPPAERAA